MFKVESYKGVDIASVVVCFDIRYFVMNKMFVHFATVEEAREDIDKTIYQDLADEWIEQNKKYFTDINFTEDERIQIGKNISNKDVV